MSSSIAPSRFRSTSGVSPGDHNQNSPSARSDHGPLPTTPTKPEPEPAAQPDTQSSPLVGRRPLPQPKRIRRYVTGTLIVIAVSAVALLGIRYNWPRSVDQFAVQEAPLGVEISGPGTLDATRKAVISARVQGRLTEIKVDRNDTVTPGELMAQIASQDLARQLDAAIAAHDASTRAVLQALADKTRSEATLTNAESTLARKSALLRQGWATQSDYDAALAARDQSAADLAHANAAIQVAEAQEKSAAATIRVNRAQLDEATIRAPFAGIVTSRDRNLGDFVTPGASIVQLADPSSVVLTARFDESAMAGVHPDQPVDLRFIAEPNRLIKGRVLRLSRIVDTETREFTVDITPDELPTNWAIGQRGTAIITTATPIVLSVPGRDVIQRTGKPGVWLLVDGRARWRAIETGRFGGDAIEIKSGLRSGDVVLKPDGVFAGMRVRPARSRT